MIVVNFSHPLTDEHIRQIEVLTNNKVQKIIDIDCQIDLQQPLINQVKVLADACHFSAEEWQTLPLVINPPSMNFISVTVLAELHGRCGYFPAHLRLRPVAGSIPVRYEVAEILDLQAIRDQARCNRVQ